ncbi:MAG: hypothetical protein HY699_00065 [Deltaproteobacteria bacterium]|nr:hypothetical protein [Deltaproteobacteria bacterium]
MTNSNVTAGHQLPRSRRPPAAGTVHAHAPLLRSLAGIVMAGTAVALAAGLRYASGVLEQTQPPAGEHDFTYVPDSRFVRVASLGHASAVADVLWFRTISYFGLHYRSDRSYRWLAKMCEVVTDLDPRAQHVYRFAGVILPWEANLPDDGIALLHKGLRQFPDDWYLHWLVGFNYYFFKDDLQPAAFHLGRAAALPGADPYVSRLAAIIYAQGVDNRAAESFLTELAASTRDDSLRQVVQQRLHELTLGRHLEALTEAVRRYHEQFGQPPENLDALVTAAVISALPREPFGGHYVFDPATGAVRSTSGQSPLRLYTSKAREQYRQGNPVHW